jgi:hypothetical protein
MWDINSSHKQNYNEIGVTKQSTTYVFRRLDLIESVLHSTVHRIISETLELYQHRRHRLQVQRLGQINLAVH